MNTEEMTALEQRYHTPIYQYIYVRTRELNSPISKKRVGQYVMRLGQSSERRWVAPLVRMHCERHPAVRPIIHSIRKNQHQVRR